jgi:DNA-directed RNA polymerase alpha subunit
METMENKFSDTIGDLQKQFNISDIKVDDVDLNTDINMAHNNMAHICKVSFKWYTDDSSIVNLLRRSILSEITTNCIEYVVFNTNSSSRQDEIIALRLGQLVINHDKYKQSDNYESKVFIFECKDDVIDITSDDVTNIDNNIIITYNTPIIKLYKNQVLEFRVIIKQGKGRDHIKFRPVSNFSFKKENNYHIVTFNSIGMLDPLTILREGFNNMDTAKNRPMATIFSKIINK